MRPFTYTNEYFNPWLLGLDAVLLLHFAYTYYWYCLRYGYKLDVWHFGALTGGVLPVLINYIFAGALENRYYLGNQVGNVQMTLDLAFEIQVLGYICMYLGFYYYNIMRGIRRSPAARLTDTWVTRLTLLFREFLETDELIYPFMISFIVAGVLLMAAVFRNGLGFNLRALTFGDSSLRPVYTVCFVAAGPILLGAIWAKYLSNRSKTTLVFALLMTVFQILSGTRGPVIIPLGTLLAVYAVLRGRRIRYTSMLLVFMLMLASAVSLQYLRNHGEDTGSPMINPLTDLAYGNEYSDTRDFAWLLSKWDGHYLYGRTELAGLVGILPRSFFLTKFRETWSFGFYENALTNLDSSYHPGVRPGRYAELFLNFGYPAVVVAGFLSGYVYRLIDDWIKRRNQAGVHDIATDFSLTICLNFLQPLYHSGIWWTVYMLLFFLAAVLFHRTIRRHPHKRPLAVAR